MKQLLALVAAVLLGCGITNAQKLNPKHLVGIWIPADGPKATIELKANGELTVHEPHDDINGNWKFDKNTNKLTFSSPQKVGDTLRFVVGSLSKTEMTLQEDGRGSMNLVKQGAKPKTEKPAKEISASKLKKDVIGVWQAYAIQGMGVLPAEARNEMTMEFKKDGSASMSERGDEENAQWEVSGSNYIQFKDPDTEETKEYKFTMDGKNLLIMDLSNGLFVIFLREGAPEPKDVSKWLTGVIDKPKPIDPKTQHENFHKMIGTWQIVEMGIENTESENMIITFNKDGKMISVTAEEGERKGKWKLSEDGSYIQIGEDYGDSYNYDYYGSSITVESITDNEIRLVDQGMPMVLKRK